MHPAAYQYVADALAKLPSPPKRVVEIGGRNINGTVRDLFAAADYTATDIADGPGVDVVADGATYQPDTAPDCVVCCEVIEHAKNWRDIIANARRILAPGGVLIVTAAGEGRAPHSALDGAGLRPGEYYANISERDLFEALSKAGFADAEVTVNEREHDIYATAVAPAKPARKPARKRQAGAS